MKQPIALFSLIIAAACGDVASPSSSSVSELNPGPAVARVEADGTITVNTEILQNTFPDGGAIAEFRVRELIDGPFLVRRGFRAGGTNTQTDVIPLQRIADRFHLEHDLHDVMLCIGGCTFCGVTYNHVSCECPNGSNCLTDWIDRTPIDVIIL
jgi:hypothetical protein